MPTPPPSPPNSISTQHYSKRLSGETEYRAGDARRRSHGETDRNAGVQQAGMPDGQTWETPDLKPPLCLARPSPPASPDTSILDLTLRGSHMWRKLGPRSLFAWGENIWGSSLQTLVGLKSVVISHQRFLPPSLELSVSETISSGLEY